MFKNTFFSYNSFLIKKLNVSSSVGSENVVFSTLISKVITYCSRYSSNFYTFLQHYKNVNWLYVTTPKNSSNIQQSLGTLFNPVFYTSQSLFSPSMQSQDSSLWFWMIYQNLFTITISKLIELYKLSILLHLTFIK